MQNTVHFVRFYLQRLLGRRYHSNEIICFKLKGNKLIFFMSCLWFEK